MYKYLHLMLPDKRKEVTGKMACCKNNYYLPAMFKLTFALLVLLQVPFYVKSQLFGLRNEVSSDLIDYEP